MIELEKSQMKSVEKLFEYTEETLIKSVLQGYMGHCWADNADHPTCANVFVGDICFLAGDYSSDEAMDIVRCAPPEANDVFIIVPQNEGWGKLVESCYPNVFSKGTRYAIKKEKDCFDVEKLQSFVDALPDKFTLRRIDEELYHKTFEHPDNRDFCGQFESAEDFVMRGIGYCAMDGDVMVGGASSYTVYRDGIEIQVSVVKEYRRMGIASACAARLILECLKLGLYPSWDAANMESVKLSEKLGYHFDFEYEVYFVRNSNV